MHVHHHPSSSSDPHYLLRWALAALLGAVLLFALAACGGGGGDSSAPASNTPTETATGLTQGAITGFGSVIVNAVRFDDSTASVQTDDGAAAARSELKLGMQVAVDSSSTDRVLGTGHAMRFRFASAVLGPVEAVSASAGTLTVMGQAVTVDSNTVYGDGLSTGLAALSTGTVVNVHGTYDATKSAYLATRIETAASATAYRLRGTVAALDSTAKTFTIGTAKVSYAGVTLPTGLTLANGTVVRVKLQTTQTSGAWVATALRSAAEASGSLAEGHVRGSITAFTSSASFTVNDTPVDASKASFPDGSTGLALGVQVEVEGTLTNGVLVATKVELDARHAGERHAFDLHGAIDSINTTAKTFVLRGITVDYSGTVTYTGGTEATLAAGKNVEVKGTPGTDKTTLKATAIKFE